MTEGRSAIDPRRLKPGYALPPGDSLYAWRPDDWNGGPRLAALLNAEMGPLAVVGPPGSGKTTELGAAAQELAKEFATILVSLDPLVKGLRTDARGLTLALAQVVARHLSERGVEIPAKVLSALELSTSPWLGARYDGVDLLHHLLRAARRSPASPPVALLIDGLDKTPAAVARTIAADLRPLGREAALVVVLAPSSVTGPEAHDLLRFYRLCSINAVPILLNLPGSAPLDAWKFLNAIALQRMGWQSWPGSLEKYVYKAALCSAGLPRSFLQFIQDAVGFSAVHAHDRITRSDMKAVYRQFHESAIRLLHAGDLPELERLKGTSGVELPLATRARLLDQGLLLEYEDDGKLIVQPHPLLTEHSVSPLADGAFL